MNQPAVEAAEIVLPCTELSGTLPFFTDRLGFRIDSIFPADDPRVAQISGFGLRLRLERGPKGDDSLLRLLCRVPPDLASGATTAPNGTRIQFVAADAPVAMPPATPTLAVSRIGDGAWHTGRAGMQYRDLVTDRQGGRIIASHIRIPDAGPVPDYVHFHKIRFQMIYCTKGWVRVVYEDQGPPFVLGAGDCVLQPPEIRHRVLESGDGLEVVEIGCPAEHMTCVDHDLMLPTGALRPERDFDGQRFVRHESAKAVWQPWRLAGFEARDTGIGAATGGIAGARVVRPDGGTVGGASRHDADTLFLFLLQGALTLGTGERAEERLGAGDSVLLPARMAHRLAECSADLELLEVAMPAGFATERA